MSGDGDDLTLRLGIDGPTNATLALVLDTTAPNFTLGNVTDVTHFSFHQESRTEELAIGNLQVRAVGTTTWNENPTAIYHFLQRFPVQGLDPDTTYEARLVLKDWAGNVATSPTYTIHTAPAPIVPKPRVEPLTPLPNSTVAPDNVILSARIELDDLPLRNSGLIVYLDKKPINENLVYQTGTLSYQPPTPLAPGFHTVGMEATNEKGGLGHAYWTFTVQEASRSETPGPAALVVVATLLIVAVGLRRTHDPQGK